jgi:hypothetical protein
MCSTVVHPLYESKSCFCQTSTVFKENGINLIGCWQLGPKLWNSDFSVFFPNSLGYPKKCKAFFSGYNKTLKPWKLKCTSTAPTIITFAIDPPMYITPTVASTWGGVTQRLSIFLSSPFWNVIAKACPPCHCNSIGINNLMNSLVVVTRLACVPLYNSPKNPQKVYSKGGIMQR